MLCLTACGTAKVSQGIQTDSRMESYDSVALARQIDRIVKEALTENLRSLSRQEVDMDRTIYSEPDSTGRQYVKETQSIKIQSSTEENRILAVESSIEASDQVDSIATSASVEDLEMESITDTHTGLPWWQKTLMMLGAAVLILLTIKLVLKFI